VDEGLLAELMRNPYYRPCPPKSAGRDEFGASELDGIQARAGETPWRATIRPRLSRRLPRARSHQPEACRRFIMPLRRVDQLIATGGGARNRSLMSMIAHALPEAEVTTAASAGVNADALEAVAFAILELPDVARAAGQYSDRHRRTLFRDPGQTDVSAKVS
jgi:anhydro-N-acetylmuramic acid kinase